MDPQEPEEVRKFTPITVTQTPKFDLDVYITNYTGRTRFRRLFLIGECSTVLRADALRSAIDEAKKGSDVRNYEDAVKLYRKYFNATDSYGTADLAWMEKKQKVNKAETNRLEHELKGYKNNLIKESIRMGSEDLGNHYYQTGDLLNATKAYGKMREYCTTPAHIVATSFRLIAVAIEQGNWLALQSQVHRVRNLQMKPDDTERSLPRIQATSGLYHMCTGNYRDAALSFLETSPSLITAPYAEVLSANDVAVYGGLCALASMTRGELQARVLDSQSFRNFLELEPHIRRAVSFFCASKYTQCLDILENYRADYLLDIYLQPHVAGLYRRIRTKSIVQYFAPFSRVTLAAVEQTFGTAPALPSSSSASATNGTSPTAPTPKPESIDAELIALISSGVLPAKIDLESRTLIANTPNPRAELHANAADSVREFIREARLRLLRMNAIQAGLEVKPQHGKGKGVPGMEGMDIAEIEHMGPREAPASVGGGK